MNLFFFDLETTGLGLDGSRIVPVQLAGIVVDSETLAEQATFSTFLKIPQEASIEQYAMDMHLKHGRDYDFFQREGQEPDTTYRNLQTFLASFGRVVPAGHNAAGYDFPILKRELMICGISPQKPKNGQGEHIDFDYHVLDTMVLAIDKLLLSGKVRSVSLVNLAKYLEIPFEGDGAHDALSDVRMTIEVYRRLRELPSPWVKEAL